MTFLHEKLVLYSNSELRGYGQWLIYSIRIACPLGIFRIFAWFSGNSRSTEVDRWILSCGLMAQGGREDR